jgi:hypothetical protein
MIEKCEKPECFKDLDEGFIFLSCFDDEPYAYIAVALNPPNAMVHFEVTRWSHNTLKKIYGDWAQFKKMMLKNDINQMVITKDGLLTEQPGYVKFLKKLGLSAPRQIMIATYDLR